MAMPETDLLRIGRWCRERVPEHLWDQVRVEAEIADRHMKFHEYTKRRPTKNVQSLLDYIGSHQDPIFWG